jgi:hypothetical protein
MNEHARPLTLSERADELEEQMMQALNERIITKSVLFRMADGRVEIDNGQALLAANPGKHFLMGADPRLPEMPEKPTLIDFFKARFASTSHMLQSATHALKGGHSEKVALACLLHDKPGVGRWARLALEVHLARRRSGLSCQVSGLFHKNASADRLTGQTPTIG